MVEKKHRFGNFQPIKKIQKLKAKSKTDNFIKNKGGQMLEYKKGSLTIKSIITFMVIAATKYILSNFLPNDVIESIIPIVHNILDVIGLGAIGGIGVGIRKAIDRIEMNQDGGIR